MRAVVQEGSDGKFYIAPISAGAYGIPFKEKWQAERVAEAIDNSFLEGQNDVRSSLRDMLGVAASSDD